MAQDPHTGFIVAAYVVAGAVIVSMILAIVTDYRGLKRSLRKFGARGLDRE
jgi:heme exporter protein CcmD